MVTVLPILLRERTRFGLNNFSKVLLLVISVREAHSTTFGVTVIVTEDLAIAYYGSGLNA